MELEGTASSGEIILGVEAAGYGASLKGGAAGAKISMSFERRGAGRSRNPILKKTSYHIRGIFAGADVFLHGAHDVGMATAEMV